MNDRSPPYLNRAVKGLISAFVIGVAVVGSTNTVSAVVSGSPFLSGWNEASLSQILIASSPFLLLALFGISGRRPWMVGLFFTAAFWAFYAYVITRPYDGGGANIGLGILMIFSPIPIAGASLLSLVTLAGARSADEVANGS